jgi:hypothetical protein
VRPFKTGLVNVFFAMEQQRRLITLTPMGNRPPKADHPVKRVKVDRAGSLNSGIFNEVSRLDKRIGFLQAENLKLSQLLAHLELAKESKQGRKQLCLDFEAQLEEQTQRLQKRREKLIQLELGVRAFRASGDLTTMSRPHSPRSLASDSPPKPKVDSDLLTNRTVSPPQSLVITPIRQKPIIHSFFSSRVEFEPVKSPVKRFLSLTPPADPKPKRTAINLERMDLLAENDRLREKSLALERLLLVQKMKLRLCHDHRDLTSLRILLEALESGGELPPSEDEACAIKSAQIGNFKVMIKHEKRRIAQMTAVRSEEDRAAVVIQSLIRGYLVRKQGKDPPSRSPEP